MPLRAELEVVPAGLIVIDPEVAAERHRTRTREFQVQGELGRGPPVLILQVNLSDGGCRSRIVGRVTNRGTVLLGEVNRDGEPFSVYGGCHVGEAGKDFVARVSTADALLDPVNVLFGDARAGLDVGFHRQEGADPSTRLVAGAAAGPQQLSNLRVLVV